MNWHFLNTGFHNGKYNMEFDVSLVQQLQQGLIPQTLRVYQWNPKAISIGYHQSENDFNLEKLSASGVDIVRRPTGGQAIFHSHELTYSVVTHLENKSLHTLYHEINTALLNAVRRLGIDAELVNSNELSKLNSDNIPCFATSAKSEIQFEGKKLIGSAQRRYGNVVLQQGTFLLGPQHRQLTEFLNVTGTDEMLNNLDLHSTDAESILGRSLSFDNAQECIRLGFEEVLDKRISETEEQHYIYET